MSPHQYVAKLDPAARLTALLNGEVDYDSVVELMPRLSFAQMRQLPAQGQGSWEDWTTRWPHPREELQEAHVRGVLRPDLLSSGGPNVGTMAMLLWQNGEISDERAAVYQARAWDGTVQLPPAVALVLATYPDLTTLLGRLPLPHQAPVEPRAPYHRLPATTAALAPAQRQRNVQFAALAVASWLQHPGRVAAAENFAPVARPHHLEALRVRAVQALEGLRQVAPWPRRLAPAAPVPVALLAAEAAEQGAPAALACLSCGDEVEDGVLVALPGCNHPPQFDLDCYVRGLDALGGHRCLEPTCLRPLGLADTEQLRLPAARALGIVVRQAHEALVQQPGWARCRTPECLGGRVEQFATREPLPCRCCGVQAPTLRGALPRYADLDAAARTQVQDLVRFAGTTRRDIVGELRPVRECYHCGMLTEHQDACMALTCPRTLGGCGGKWDFVEGREVAHAFDLVPARYVPKSSWLVDLGLYEGLAPGSVGVHGVADVLAANLRRLQQAA